MLVEFAGCSGAGKSTLCGRVRALLRCQQMPVVTPLDLVWWRPFASCTASTRLSNVAFEIASRRWTQAALRAYQPCWSLARTFIEQRGQSRRERWRLSRSVRRKLTTAYLGHAAAAGKLLLVDEGCLQLAHILFGRAWQGDPTELDGFVAALPQPHLVIHVVAPVHALRQRIAERGRPPLPDRGEDERRQFLTHSHEIFSHVYRDSKLRSKRWSVDNSASDRDSLEATAIQIAQRVAAVFQDQNEKTVNAADPTNTRFIDRHDSTWHTVPRPRVAHPA